VSAVKARDKTKATPQTILFHEKTFHPSNMPRGTRLKRAIQALKAALSIATSDSAPEVKDDSASEISERPRLVDGPAMAVLPIVFLFMDPAIITAPGEMILIGTLGIAERRVNKAPKSVRRNSAHSPYR